MTCLWCNTPVPDPLPDDWYTISSYEAGWVVEHVCPACVEETDTLVEIVEPDA